MQCTLRAALQAATTNATPHRHASVLTQFPTYTLSRADRGRTDRTPPRTSRSCGNGANSTTIDPGRDRRAACSESARTVARRCATDRARRARGSGRRRRPAGLGRLDARARRRARDRRPGAQRRRNRDPGRDPVDIISSLIDGNSATGTTPTTDFGGGSTSRARPRRRSSMSRTRRSRATAPSTAARSASSNNTSTTNFATFTGVTIARNTARANADPGRRRDLRAAVTAAAAEHDHRRQHDAINIGGGQHDRHHQLLGHGRRDRPRRQRREHESVRAGGQGQHRPAARRPRSTDRLAASAGDPGHEPGRRYRRVSRDRGGRPARGHPPAGRGLRRRGLRVPGAGRGHPAPDAHGAAHGLTHPDARAPAPAPTVSPTPAPTPVFHKSVVVQKVSGTVRVKLPGAEQFVDLNATEGVPLGSTVDTKHGEIVLFSVPKAGAAPQSARFYEGIFTVTQAGSITNLRAQRAARALPEARPRRCGGQETQETPPLGRRLRQLPHRGRIQRRHRARHQVARGGQLRRHPHPRLTRCRFRPRQSSSQNDRPARRQALSGQAAALDRNSISHRGSEQHHAAEQDSWSRRRRRRRAHGHGRDGQRGELHRERPGRRRGHVRRAARTARRSTGRSRLTLRRGHRRDGDDGDAGAGRR